MTTTHIVVGGGIAGVSAALYMRRAGLDVTLIDPLPSPGGASFGNAGIISADTVVPISVPGMLRKVPSWLMDPLGPLTIRKSYLPRATPWLLRWLWAGRMRQVLKSSDALRALHSPIWDVYRDLLGANAFADLLRPFGHVQLWDGELESPAAALERRLRERHGVKSQPLRFDELREMFPGLAKMPLRGILIPGNGHIVSPRRLVSHLAAVALAEGVRFVPERVLKLIPREAGDWTVMTNAANHRAARVLVAAGAWSATLLNPLGLYLPLDTERGYHAMFSGSPVQLTHTVLHKDWGVALSPFEEGLCASGTVEIAGLHAPPDERRAAAVARRAMQLFPELEGVEPTIWIGFRPSIPDSLPVIGAAPGFRGLFLLFGHGHNGMTGGPTGARLVTELMQNQAPFIDPTPYAASRFLRGAPT
ncbi:FAD-binding oxidoreductase [Mesorhizobium sp. M7A.F.Ca.US.006.01.1.1]|uniref:NAD(P)/FAD-dependent oxidoreductase n=1 Tax=Mesorhizobium sp. M7A.F.Ca.US.006.01.1.1 TaxID=2496707 RepID=UPI0013E293A3|nr:FAD-binding oxidoreductase [Mesorhizobium sp. M7A.F.Ca.US.006.01.1.1]